MKSSKIKKAPVALADAPTPQEEAVSMEASPITSSTKAMFAKPESNTVTTKDAKAAVKNAIKAANAKPAAPVKVKQTAKILEKEMLKPVAPEAAPPQEPKPAPAPPAKVSQKLEILAKIESPELKKLGEGFMLEELQDPYTNPAPRAYVPETHRNFSKFIKMNYADFILPPPGQGPAIQPGDKYPYQKFIREYMRQASPYRGILVYHGLGSGKTCSAIAASEALFATAGKKIIVMTPFSLRKNFLKEVSFCGFRHFRLLNFWVGLDKANPTHRMFALEILGLSENYIRTAAKIWVPDFDQKTPNYADLSATEQTEIRKQILSQLVWDSEKNPKGRIRFINYNGISAKKLKKIACETPDFFDDAVIVVDEIHNLVRLIQGEIDPYLKDLPGVKRKVARELVTVDQWKPSLCGKETNYRRGYLFYRLMLSARRSKLIGLSGTPLINFPEELGILANILHGYIPLLKGTLQQTGDEAQAAIKKIAAEHPHIDYVNVERSNESLAGTELTATLLPDGIRKVKGADGVERMSGAGPTPTEIMSSLVEALKGSGFTFRGEPTLTATPLLHPYGDEFREDFLTADGLDVKNKFILGKRLTGLVSYYKGSREDLMPAVASDEVIRVPFSTFSQGAYSKVRLEEIDIEMKKKDKGTGGLGNVWAEVYDIGQMQQSSNYRMGSRQMCNFAFPTTVTRPRARNTEEEEMENVEDKEIIDTAPDNAPDAPTEAEAFDFPEIDEVAEEEKEGQEDEVSVAEEKKQIYAALNKIFGKMAEEGKTIEDVKEKDEGGREYFKVAIPLSEEKLALINGDFKTLVFTPDGFSGVTGDDFTDDFGVLTSRFPQEGGVGEDDKPTGTISFKEAMARRRAAGTGLQAVRSLGQAAAVVAEPEPSNAAVAEAAVVVPSDAALAEPAAALAEPVHVAAPEPAPEPVAELVAAPTISYKAAMAKKKTVAAEIKAIDKQVKIQEVKRAANRAKEGPVKETALEKMFAKMRDKDGKLPAHLAISVEVDKAARIAGASQTQISAAIRVAQEVFHSRKTAGASNEEALADGKLAGAKEYAVISEENGDDYNNAYDDADDDAELEEPPAAAPTISYKEAMAKKKVQTQVQAPTISYAEAMAKRREAQTKAAALEQQLEAMGAVKPVKPVAAPVQATAIKPQEQLRCKGPRQDGETYKQALIRAKSCLKTIAASKLRLNTEEDSLAKYSPKYAAILQRIMDAPGSSLVYSQFLDMEGIGIFRVVMDINDFSPIEIISTAAGPAFTPQTEASLKKGPGGQMRYMTFSGEEKEDVRRMALDVFNARFDELPERMKTVLQESGFKDNHTGQLCRVFCITSAGAEGLSLKNVRAVHIMEPYWNDVRLKQVKGRAIRIGSHLELPPEQRNVSIYTYISVFGEDAQLSKEGDTRIDETIRLRDIIDRPTAIKVGLPIPASAASYVLTSDERLYVISERKKKVIEELEKVMKGAAVDCELSAAENLDGTYQCLLLDKMVGDFAYEPELKKDISRSEYTYKEETRLVKAIKWAGVKYWAGANKDATGTITGFTLYAEEDRDLITPLGETGVANGSPAEPVKIY
jgi:hypothetical protein